ATALGLTLIPTITKTYTEKNQIKLQQQISQTYQMLLYLTLPAAIGLSVLAYSAYGALYGVNDVALGGEILRWYAPTAVLFAIFTASAAILQGINQQKLAVFALLCGVLVKMLLNRPFIEKWEGIGAIAATDIGYIISILFCLYAIKKYARISFQLIMKRTLLIGMLTTVMGIVVWIVKWPFELLLASGYTSDANYFLVVFILIIGVITGGAVYLWMGNRLNLIKIIF